MEIQNNILTSYEILLNFEIFKATKRNKIKWI